MKPSRGELLLMLLALIVTLVGLEIALRILDYDPLGELHRGKGMLLRISEWDDLRYQLTPGVSLETWNTWAVTNSAGLRDDETPFAKDGRFRIAVLGDSFTFGNGVLHDELYTEVLESSLRDRLGPRVDVINLAVGGYDVGQEVASLARIGLRYEPDLVILGYCTNDIGHVSPNLEYIRDLDELRSPLYRLRAAQLARVLRDRVANAAQFLLEKEEDVSAANRDRILPVDGPEEVHLQEAHVVEAVLLLEALAEAQGV